MARPARDDQDQARIVVGPPPAEYTPEQWHAKVLDAHLTLVRVLLRARERLITEGRITPRIR